MILSRRSVRAGLGIPSNLPGVPQPRGDLDVMLSMRMQGMLHSLVKSSFNLADDTGKPEQNGSTEETATTPRPPSLRSRPSSASDPLTNWRYLLNLKPDKGPHETVMFWFLGSDLEQHEPLSDT
jgi:hypothetical protein